MMSALEALPQEFRDLSGDVGGVTFEQLGTRAASRREHPLQAVGRLSSIGGDDCELALLGQLYRSQVCVPRLVDSRLDRQECRRLDLYHLRGARPRVPG